MPFFLDRPTANPDFNSSAVAKEYGVTNNYLPPIRPLFSPRVGFRYDVDADSRYVIRGGTGIFTGRVPFVWIANSFSNSGMEYLRTAVLGTNVPTMRFNADVNHQFTQPGKTTEIDMVGTNFRYPQVWRSNLAFDAKLPGGFRASLEGMYTRNLNSVRYRNLLLRDNGTLDQAMVRSVLSTRSMLRSLSSTRI